MKNKTSPEIARYQTLIKRLANAEPNSNDEKQAALLLASLCGRMAQRTKQLESKVRDLESKSKKTEICYEPKIESFTFKKFFSKLFN